MRLTAVAVLAWSVLSECLSVGHDFVSLICKTGEPIVIVFCDSGAIVGTPRFNLIRQQQFIFVHRALKRQ